MNIFAATGNLGSDVEMRYLPNQDAVANFSLAINERTTVNGEKKEKTVWVRVTVWRAQAESCAKYIHKGSKVGIRGKLEPINTFTKRDGTPGASYEVTAAEVEFLDSLPQSTDDAAPAPKPMQAATQPAKRAPEKEEDIPW